MKLFIEPKFKLLYPEDVQEDFKTIEELFSDFEIIVVLGAPGSGKTEWLGKLHERIEPSEFLTVQEFIDNPYKQNGEETCTLLLDGLDEYRSTLDKQKAFLVNRLTKKINDLSSQIRIVLSCRELDWYGESDKTALEKNTFDKKVCVVHLLPFDEQQQFAMIKNEVVDEDLAWDLYNRFESFGIMANPQMLYMILTIYKADNKFGLKSKTELYEEFIRLANEHNIIHRISQNTTINKEESVNLLGYLAFYYFFANQNLFNQDFLNEIKWDDEGYSLEKLETITKTKLFNEQGKIIHRTIFEYAIAKFIKQKLLDTEKWSEKRVLAYLSKSGSVYSEFRGVFSWLCSLTQSIEFIKIEPYNQLIYGDNYAFTVDLKKQVLLEIEQFAKNTLPYFYNYEHEYQFVGFYEPDLDEFLIDKLVTSKKGKNHFGLFISALISVAENPSSNLKENVKKLIFDESIPVWFKTRLIKIFKPDDVFLIEVLDSIISNLIKDAEFGLMSVILKRTYPLHLSVESLKKYLPYFKSDVIGYASFLDKTPEQYKKGLVGFILEKCKVGKSHSNMYRRFPRSLEDFIEDYFMELVESYPAQSARNIYETLKYFKSNYFEKWAKLEFRGYRYYAEEKKKSLLVNFQQLANELFELYVKDWLENDNDNDDFNVLDFSNLFDIETPQNRVGTILSFINKQNSKEKNFRIYQAALRHRTQDDKEKLFQIAQEYDFIDEFNRFFNPKRQKWEIEQDKQEVAREKEKKIERENNEAYFSTKNEDELLNNFSVMHWFAKHFFVGGGTFTPSKVNVEIATYERLFNLFKSYYCSGVKEVVENCTLESLYKEAPTANRAIDWVVYTSITATEWEKECIPIDELHKYLYVLSVLEEHVGNIIKNDFLASFEKQHQEKHLDILKEFTFSLFKYHAKSVSSIVNSFIQNETNADKLKRCIRLFKNENEQIFEPLLYNFLINFGLFLSEDDLKKLQSYTNLEKSQKIIIGLIKLYDESKPMEKAEIYAIMDLLGSYSNDYEELENLGSVRKFHLVKKMMDVFDTEESVSFRGDYFEVARFLKQKVLQSFEKNDLEDLLKVRIEKNITTGEDFWQNEIKQVLHDKYSQEISFDEGFYSIQQIKKVLKEDEVGTYADFFRFIEEELKSLIQTIEINDDNELNVFFEKGKPKKENDCRDIITRDLKNRNFKKFILIREFNRANNRVDLKIQSTINVDWIVYLEAKRNSNSKLKTGIIEQLIDKYLNEKVTFGIYLVFNFGKKSKVKLISEIEATIPHDYKQRIKVLCLDLKFNSHKNKPTG